MSVEISYCLFLLRMVTTLPYLRVLVLVLLGRVEADGRNLDGGDGSLVEPWEERHRRAPPDAEEGGGRDLLRGTGEVELCIKIKVTKVTECI